MKNLKLSSKVSSDLDLHSEDDRLRFTAFDIEHNRLFFASSSNFIYTTQLPSSQNEGAQSKTSLTAVEAVDLEPGDFITSFDYLMEKESLIIGTSNGLLLLYNVDDNSTELVGKVEGGVKFISPSPDGDLLAVVTGFGQLLVMTHDWDLLYENALEDPSEDAAQCESSFSPNCLYGNPISWRGDGKYFATISKVQDSSSHKKIKIWERDTGSLHAVSESKSFLADLVEWMPSGAKIAAIYDTKNESKSSSVVFYERNGLERSSFTINEEKGSTVEIMKWNSNSDVLAAIVRSDNHDSIKIWYFSNNHWYLKHEIRFPKSDGVRFMWDPTKPLQMISWTVGGQVSTYNFIWITAVTDNSTALVIDDDKILVTPLSIAVIPPPMYLFALKFRCAIRETAFWCKSSKIQLAAYLSDGSLCVAELPEIDTWEDLEGKEFYVEALESETFGSVIHLIWLDSHSILSVYYLNLEYYLQEIEIMCSEDQIPGTVTSSGWRGKVSGQTSIDRPVIGIALNPVKKFSSYIQFEGGNVFEYTSNAGLRKHDDLGFSSSCPWMNIVLIGECGSANPILLFGLDNNGRLHVGGKIICNNCNSFSFYSNSTDRVATHLILATKQDLLYIVDISDILLGQLEAKYNNFVPLIKKRGGEDENNCINIWERGAKIVGLVHGDESAVILQTNRGNLECIYPRKLVVVSIVNALVQGRFRDAINMVRQHRIDFNVIVDHCGYKAFLELASNFVEQVDNLSFITEFICSIKNENVMETLYKNHISVPFIKDANNFNGCDDSKVSCVLMAVKKALEEKIAESPSRELCILTTLARTNPPSIEEALERIKVIRDVELSGFDDPRKELYPSAEESLKHLLWLSDADAVYDAALGLYDLNLAAIVALNSQRDPKEFLPFLQELERMPTNLMRHNIDLKLKRFENALKHIISAGEDHFEDSLNLVKNNPDLFPLGLQLITDPVKRRRVIESYGDHLSEVKSYEDAATNYLCCLNYEKALKAYRSCGNWSGVMTVGGLIKLGKDEITLLANELCEELQALGKPGEAAKIALDYCGDVNLAINLLISARSWEEGLRVCFMNRRDDLVKEVKSGALECAGTMFSEFNEGLEKVGKYWARYLAVRQRRLLLAAKIQADDRSVNEFDDDTVSEASSNFSGMSAYTTGTRRGSSASTRSTTSSKARGSRRQKKAGKIRAGSPGEELALVDHLKGMSLTIGGKRELKSLIISLVMLGNDDMARKLQRLAENFQLSQIAAVKLAEHAMSSDIVDEQAYSLEHYILKTRKELLDSEDFSWQSKVFISP
jgi:elongator complex protein 1